MKKTTGAYTCGYYTYALVAWGGLFSTPNVFQMDLKGDINLILNHLIKLKDVQYDKFQRHERVRFHRFTLSHCTPNIFVSLNPSSPTLLVLELCTISQLILGFKFRFHPVCFIWQHYLPAEKPNIQILASSTKLSCSCQGRLLLIILLFLFI